MRRSGTGRGRDFFRVEFLSLEPGSLLLVEWSGRGRSARPSSGVSRASKERHQPFGRQIWGFSLGYLFGVASKREALRGGLDRLRFCSKPESGPLHGARMGRRPCVPCPLGARLGQQPRAFQDRGRRRRFVPPRAFEAGGLSSLSFSERNREVGCW